MIYVRAPIPPFARTPTCDQCGVRGCVQSTLNSSLSTHPCTHPTLCACVRSPASLSSAHANTPPRKRSEARNKHCANGPHFKPKQRWSIQVSVCPRHGYAQVHPSHTRSRVASSLEPRDCMKALAFEDVAAVQYLVIVDKDHVTFLHRHVDEVLHGELVNVLEVLGRDL